MSIRTHLQVFAGLPVHTFNPADPFAQGTPGEIAYRVNVEHYSDNLLPILEQYLSSPQALATTVLVIGTWNADDSSAGNTAVVQALAQGSQRLPRLRALFVGDIIKWENEISWISQSDLTPLLDAFPNLEQLRVRGSLQLAFAPRRHDKLRHLGLESGGLQAEVFPHLWKLDLPALEHLELWLGSPFDGACENVEPILPLLSGALFPALSYLGLRNSEIADDVAGALASFPLLHRIPFLDLSMGTLSDRGALALLQSPAIANLKSLDIHHHYVSPEVVEQLRARGFAVNADDPQDPNEPEEDRYNVHSE